MSKKYKIICYIQTIISFLFFISCLNESLYIIALLWLIVALIFIPAIKNKIIKYIPNIKKSYNLLRIIILTITFFVFGLAIPPEFEGEWISNNNDNIIIDNNNIILNINNDKYSGTYEYKDNSENKIITVNTKDKKYHLNYTNHNNKITLCLVEDNKCKIYFTPKNKEDSYTYITSNDNSKQKESKTKKEKLPDCDGIKITSNCKVDNTEYLTYKYYPAIPEKSHTETKVTYTEEIVSYCTKCNDGTYSPSCATGRGACSHHGGVAQWNAPVYRNVPHYEEVKIIDSEAIPEKWEKITK